jgi:L-2-hydroxyglutarate oxidase LhgO
MSQLGRSLAAVRRGGNGRFRRFLAVDPPFRRQTGVAPIEPAGNGRSTIYAGIRPKISGPDEPDADFLVQQADHGIPGLVNLYGIESPGLTASLSLADEVLKELAG